MQRKRTVARPRLDFRPRRAVVVQLSRKHEVAWPTHKPAEDQRLTLLPVASELAIRETLG